jgi:hypothetical protein
MSSYSSSDIVAFRAWLLDEAARQIAKANP